MTQFYLKRDFRTAELCAGHCLKGFPQLDRSSFDRPELVGRKFKDCNPTTAKVLLIGETLIGCEEQIKLRFGKSEGQKRGQGWVMTPAGITTFIRAASSDFDRVKGFASRGYNLDDPTAK